MTETIAGTPPSVVDRRTSATVALGLLLAGGAVVAGGIVGHLVERGNAASAMGLLVVLLPILIWKKPQLAPALVVAVALTVEQFRYTVGTGSGAITDRIPLFHGLGQGAHVTPADLLLLSVLVIWLLKRGADSSSIWPRSPLGTSVLALAGAVVLGLFVGLEHHGSVRVALMEIRPYAYLITMYVLSSALLTTRTALRAILWVFVLGSGVKAVQGLQIFLSVRHLRPRPDAVLAHEEALFFGLSILLTLALWLFGVAGALRKVATALLPVVLAADLANARRTAWLILAAGCIALLAIGLVALPARRRFIARLSVAIAIVAAVYLPAYWHHTGGLAQPARAVRSVIAPDPRDASSNLYRVQENANLRLNISEGGVLGRGFGVPIDYPLPIADISTIDPLIAYIPHDGVLYILVRMGVLGGVAFWSILAVGIIGGCALARSRDRELAVIGALAVCALLAYALQGYNDQGFFFYRIAFVIGSVLGMTEAGLRLNHAELRSGSGPRGLAPSGVTAQVER